MWPRPVWIVACRRMSRESPVLVKFEVRRPGCSGVRRARSQVEQEVLWIVLRAAFAPDEHQDEFPAIVHNRRRAQREVEYLLVSRKSGIAIC